jgi:hypothetical protein
MGGEKSEKPQHHQEQNHEQSHARSADPEAGGTRAGAGFAGVMAERDAVMDQLRFRMTNGARGTAPAANVMAQRRKVIGEAAARIMRKGNGTASATHVTAGSGTPLPPDVKSKMESKMGADFSSVRVFTGNDSAKAASDFGARAFTVGTNVHFNSGQFAPGTKEGDRLLAHELTHVVQAKNSGSVIQRKEDEDAKGHQVPDSGERDAKAGTESPASESDGDEAAETASVSQPHEPAEKEADEVGDRIADELHDAKGDASPKNGRQSKSDGKKSSERGDGKASDAPKADDRSGAGASHSEGTPEEKGSAESKSPEAAGKAGAHTIQAKLEGVGRKIFRAAGPSSAPQPSPNGSPTPPADPWTQFCSTLPGDLKDKALGISDEEQRTVLRTVGLEFARAFLALTSRPCRLEMARLGWQQNAAIQTMALAPDELFIYEQNLDGAKRVVWRDQLTVDERKDAKTMPPDALTKILTIPSELQNWRTLRTKQVLSKQVVDGLIAAGENPDQIANVLSASRGGDRLRRILQDPQLPPATVVRFMLDVKAKLATIPDPFEAMKAVQPAYKLLGNDASKDGAFATMEILKALPILNFAKFGSIPTPQLIEACATAPESDNRIPRKSDKSVNKQRLAEVLTDDNLRKSLAMAYFPEYGKQGLDKLSGCDVGIVGGRVGKELLPAYWMYDAKAQMTLAMKADAVSKALAVDENPDYLRGAVITALPDSIKAQYGAQGGIKRPTAIDGLAFDQFQLVDDPNQCFGITAGGMGEVTVAPIMFSQTTPKRTF